LFPNFEAEISNFGHYFLYAESYYEDDPNYKKLNKYINKIPSGIFTTLECNQLYNILLKFELLVKFEDSNKLSIFDAVHQALIAEIKRMHKDGIKKSIRLYYSTSGERFPNEELIINIEDTVQDIFLIIQLKNLL
jgi:hypothetical protein